MEKVFTPTLEESYPQEMASDVGCASDEHTTDGILGADTEVLVSAHGGLLWARGHRDGIPTITSKRSRAMLEQVVAILSEALEEAQGELALMIRSA